MNAPTTPIASVMQKRVNCSFFASETTTFGELDAAEPVELALLLPFKNPVTVAG